MRNLLGGVLKDNIYLEKGVLTGILRVAKESLFSGLNNVRVYTLINENFSDKFGFTEKEVEAALNYFNLSENYADCHKWYNGYNFGGTTIYNPWSIMQFMESKGILMPYWINTADNTMIKELVLVNNLSFRDNFTHLIENGYIEINVDENIVYSDINSRENSVWSFFLMTGYLTYIDYSVRNYKHYYKLCIPNIEIQTLFNDIIEMWLTRGDDENRILRLVDALQDGDIQLFERELKSIVLSVFSFHDFGQEPEKVYHAFILGLLVWLSADYEIKSNRESGLGRYDLALKPKSNDNSPIIMEFKKIIAKRKDDVTEEVVQNTLISALKQIDDYKYETEFLADFPQSSVLKLAIVFYGKDVWVLKGK